MSEYTSLTGKPERITSTSGHIVFVPCDGEFVSLPPHMEPDARAAGCISREMFEKIAMSAGKKDSPAPVIPLMPAEETARRATAIADKLREMVNGDDPSYFTKAGLPVKRVVDGLTGFSSTNGELKAGWETVTAEIEAEEKAKTDADADAPETKEE